MQNRLLYQVAFSSEWGRQMRFITGPRQAGKTTLARQKLTKEQAEKLYYLWDLRSIKNRYRNNELFFTEDTRPRDGVQWICFDEMHKIPKWKNILKGIFDETWEHYRFIITGSAKLDISRRAGDSLTGRYFTFRLFPFIMAELAGPGNSVTEVPSSAEIHIQNMLDRKPTPPDLLEGLLAFSGFPEPCLKQSAAFQNKWQQDYLETVVRDDIGQLTRIIDRDNLIDLYNLLPEMTGSPISEASIAAHLQTSPQTIKNYLKRLEDFYLTFSLRPFSKNIKRSLLKAAKVYFYDWSKNSDPARVFENYVACELKTRISLWQDTSGEQFGLCYIRNKQKQETDFLITRQQKPWLLVEAKTGDRKIERHHADNAAVLRVPLVQVCREPGIAALQKRLMYRISADRFFTG